MATSSSVAALRGGPNLATGIGDSAWDVMVAQARVLVNSGFLPDTIKTPEQAIAIMMTGEELGIRKMLALRSIVVIKGKPTLSADLMASLIHREIDRHKDGVFDVQPPTPTECTVRFRRWGRRDLKSFTYTMADATRAQLAGNDNYKKHPAAMLRARATAHAARMEFPDVIAGIYAPEEVDVVDGDSGSADAGAWGNVTVLRSPEDAAVDASPQSDPISLTDDVKRLRELIGWSAQDVVNYAAEQGWNLRKKADLQQMHDRLQEWHDNAKESSDPYQETQDIAADGDADAIDAEFAPVEMGGMPPVDRYTDH